jgi:hypothetical protein
MILFYGLNGETISEKEWSKLFGSPDRIVAKMNLPDQGVVVSTIWIGLSFSDELATGDRPLIYETMVFPENDYLEIECFRWATRYEAAQGHAEVVDKVVSGEISLGVDLARGLQSDIDLEYKELISRKSAEVDASGVPTAGCPICGDRWILVPMLFDEETYDVAAWGTEGTCYSCGTKVTVCTPLDAEGLGED